MLMRAPSWGGGEGAHLPPKSPGLAGWLLLGFVPRSYSLGQRGRKTTTRQLDLISSHVRVLLISRNYWFTRWKNFGPWDTFPILSAFLLNFMPSMREKIAFLLEITQWKPLFHPDVSKQGEVLYSCLSAFNELLLYFTNIVWQTLHANPDMWPCF